MMGRRVAATADTALALVALARTGLLFRLGGQQAVARATHRAMAVRPAAAAELAARGADPWRTFRAVQRARRLWPERVMCLQGALALQQALAARGVAAAVRVGVRREGDALLAHAWVETGGLVMDGSAGHQAFTPFEIAARAEQGVTG